MKRLSEVSKITGMTRRTLQEYDRIGLLSPTSKTEGGYWLYDDEAVKTLFLIRIFVEVGYDRNTIKDIFSQPKIYLMDEYEKVLEFLEEKKKRINGMINWIKGMMTVSKISEEAIMALSRIDLGYLYKEKSFSKYIEESISRESEHGEEYLKEAEMYMPFFYQTIALACLKDEKPDSIIVRKNVKGLYDYLFEMALKDEDWDSDDEEAWNELTESERTEDFSEGVLEMLKDEELCKLIRMQAGDEGPEFIKEALAAYAEYLKQEELKGK